MAPTAVVAFALSVLGIYLHTFLPRTGVVIQESSISLCDRACFVQRLPAVPNTAVTIA
jgi:hypothetical protein